MFSFCVKLNASYNSGPNLAKIENGSAIIKNGCGETLTKSCCVQPLLFALQARYVGQTDRHLLTRFKEHLRPSEPFGKHIRLCGVSPSFENSNDVSVLQSTSRSVVFLETLEALMAA